MGKGLNKKLQDTGNLRQRFTPSSFRATATDIVWFNNAKTAKGFPYAAHHDKPDQRPFMWLSDDALERVALYGLNYIMGD